MAQIIKPPANPFTLPSGSSAEDEWQTIEDDSDWVTVEENGRPVQQEEPSLWERLNTAPEFVTRPAREFSEWLREPQLNETNALNPYLRGFLGGAVEGAAELFSPLNVGLAAVGAGEVAAVRSAARLRDIGRVIEARNMGRLASAAETATKAASIPVGYEGVTSLFNPESTFQDRLMAVPQIAGAALGLRNRVRPALREIGSRPQSVGTAQAGDINVARGADDIFRAETATPDQFAEGVLGGQEIHPRATPPQSEVSLTIPPTATVPPTANVPFAPLPGTVIVKKDIPNTINQLMEKGYEFAGMTEQGYPRMVLKQQPQIETPAIDEAGRQLEGTVGPESTGLTVPQTDPFTQFLQRQRMGQVQEPPTENILADPIDEGRVVPQRRAIIQRGMHTPVTVVFENPIDKEIFSLVGRSRRQIGGESGIPPNLDNIAAQLGVDRATAYRLANQYREQVLQLTKGIDSEAEGAVVRAPRFNRDLTEEPSFSRVIPFTGRQLPPRKFDAIFHDLEMNMFSREAPYSEQSHDALMEEAEKSIVNSDSENLIDIFNNLEEEFVRATSALSSEADANPDLVENIGFLRDIALDRINKMGLRNRIRTIYDQDYFINDEPQMSRITDEQGNPIETREFTDEELTARKKQIATDWYNARRQARELGIDDKQFRHLSDLRNAIAATGNEPSFARAEGGKVKIGADVESLGRVLGSSLYQGDIATIATKELLQNSLDAIRPLGAQGQIKVKLERDEVGGKPFVRVEDNGPGLTRAQVETIFTDLGSSGKRSDESAIGGFGLAKAAPLLGGEHVIVSTVAREADGKLYATEFDGTPEEMLRGVEIDHTPMSEGTPTGTSVTVRVPSKSSFYDARKFINNIGKYSNFEGNVQLAEYGGTYKALTKTDRSKAKVIATLADPAADVTLSLPGDVTYAERSNIELILLNKGMYQGMKYHYLMSAVPNLPDKIIVDISSNVPEGDPNYPFTANREALRGTSGDQVEKYITEEIVSPTLSKRKGEIQRIYDEMPHITLPGGGNIYYYDPHGKFRPEDIDTIMGSQSMQLMSKEFSSIIDDMMRITKDAEWSNKYERLGIIFEPKVKGIYIPNPKEGKAAILINPLQIMDGISPDEAAAGLVHTVLHELVHLSFGQHNESFTIKLSQVYEKYGARNAVDAQDKFLGLIASPNREYTPEIQSLLRRYTRAIGRESTKEDLLTGTGIGSKATNTGAGKVPSGGGPNGAGTSGQPGQLKRIVLKQDTKETRQALIAMGYQATGISNKDGFPIWEKPIETEAGLGRELYNLPRGMMSIDPPFLTSAMFRQGLPMTGVNIGGWFKAWMDQARAYGSEQAYQGIINDFSKDPLFRRQVDKNGKEQPSIAEQLGLDIPSLGEVSKREELIRSKWAENIPLYGKHVRASNRAFTAAIFSLRASAFKKFIDQAQQDNRSFFGRDIAPQDPITNVVLGKQIAEAINTLTGRGKMKLDIPGREPSGEGKTLNFERATKFLTDLFFSPRLMASRIKMLNPSTYINANPFVRKLYLKGLLGAITTWWTIASLIELAGGEVVKDPNSADFGKGKIGNTRIDAGGGFQQHLVLFSRLRPEWFVSPVDVPFPPFGEMIEDPGGGKFTSSTSGQTSYLGEGFRPETRGSLVRSFFENKMHPTAKFAWDILNASGERPVYLGDRTLQQFLPMMTGDLLEVMREDPALVPVVFGASGIGMGAQTYEGGRQTPSITPSLGLDEFDITIGGR